MYIVGTYFILCTMYGSKVTKGTIGIMYTITAISFQELKMRSQENNLPILVLSDAFGGSVCSHSDSSHGPSTGVFGCW